MPEVPACHREWIRGRVCVCVCVCVRVGGGQGEERESLSVFRSKGCDYMSGESNVWLCVCMYVCVSEHACG